MLIFVILYFYFITIIINIENNQIIITVLPRIHRHAGIGEDDHFLEKGIMVSIPTCRYKAGYAFSQNFFPSLYTFFIIQICLTSEIHKGGSANYPPVNENFGKILPLSG